MGLAGILGSPIWMYHLKLDSIIFYLSIYLYNQLQQQKSIGTRANTTH